MNRKSFSLYQEKKILIVEDEKNLGQTLVDYLNSTGLKAHWAANSHQAMDLFDQLCPDIILMDIGLPDGNGLELAKTMRGLRQDFILLFVSAQNDPQIRVDGLEIGADDYITKPFALKELMFRLEKALKTHGEFQNEKEEIAHGPLRIWFKRYQVQDASGNIVNLSQKECAILKILYARKNEAVPREDIINKVWGEDKFPSNRTVDNYIVKLRKWSESDTQKTIEIQSIRAIGYKINIKEEE